MFRINQTSTQDSNMLTIFQTTYWGSGPSNNSILIGGIIGLFTGMSLLGLANIFLLFYIIIKSLAKDFVQIFSNYNEEGKYVSLKENVQQSPINALSINCCDGKKIHCNEEHIKNLFVSWCKRLLIIEKKVLFFSIPFVAFQILNMTMMKLIELMDNKSLIDFNKVKDKHSISIEENNSCSKKSPSFIIFICISSLLLVGTILGLFIATSKELNIEPEYSNSLLDRMISKSVFSRWLKKIVLLEFKHHWWYLFSNHRSIH